jgi:hypothetical protein
MDHAAGVRVREGHATSRRYRTASAGGSGPLALSLLRETFTFNETHRKEGVPADFVGVVDGNDIRVREMCGCSRSRRNRSRMSGFAARSAEGL